MGLDVSPYLRSVNGCGTPVKPPCGRHAHVHGGSTPPLPIQLSWAARTAGVMAGGYGSLTKVPLFSGCRTKGRRWRSREDALAELFIAIPSSPVGMVWIAQDLQHLP